MVFNRGLSNSKSSQVSRALLSIPDDLNNAVVFIVSTQSSYFQVLPSLNQSFGDWTPRTPITISCPTVILIPLSFSSLSFKFTQCSAGRAKPTILQVLFFVVFFFFVLFFCWLSNGLVDWPRLGYPFVYQNPRGVCMSHFLLFVWSNFSFLHNSQWISLPTKSYLVLYSFCANLLHSLINRFVSITT